MVDDGGGWCRSHTFASLVPGAVYELSVQAINAVGTGTAGTARITMGSAATVPGVPVSVVAVRGGAAGTATVSWQPPASDGGLVTGYRVARDGTDAGGAGPWSMTVAAGARSHTFASLVPGAVYELSVQAINAVGTGTAGTARVTMDGGGAGGGARFVSDLPFVSASNAWGPVERDRSNGEAGAADGRTLTLQGQTFVKGLGTHAGSDVRFVVPAGCTTLTAVVGLDDEVGSGGSAVFQVFDGVSKTFDSGARTGASANVAVTATLTPGATARLVTTDNGNGNGNDHTDWADAKLTCNSTATLFATDLAVPWSLAPLPHGGSLVSERETALVKYVRADRTVVTLGRVPGVEVPHGEAGLLGLALSPSYAQDRLLYAYTTTAVDNRVVRMTVDLDGSLGAPTVVLAGIPKGLKHHGGRIAFGPDGHLYIGTGDTGNGALAQDRSSLAGKVLRVTRTGSPVADNPISGSPVFSIGHRNVQGLAFDAGGRLLATELGESRFDEVNLIRSGANYGWPTAEGAVGDARFTDPLLTWSPAESSPSGAAVASGALWVAALRGERLWRVPVGPSGALGGPETAVTGFGRLRDVALQADGSLWVLANQTTSARAGVVSVPVL